MKIRIWASKSKEISEPLGFEKLFVILAFSLILIAWFALFLTELGIFYKAILIPIILLVLVLALLFLRKHKGFEKLSKIDIFALLIIVFFAIFNTIYFHDVFTGGIDEGTYANSAVYLARNHDLILDEYQVTGLHEGTNFQSIGLAGWYMANGYATTVCYPGYISWIALHYSFLGIFGVRVSNFLLMIICLLSLYFIGKKLNGSKVGITAVVMFATTFPMLWFTRRTNSEILLLALVWFGILCFLKAYESKQPNYLIPMLFAFGIAIVSRIESAAMFLAIILLLIFLHFQQKEKIFSKRFVILTLIAIGPFIYYHASSPTGHFLGEILVGAPVSTVEGIVSAQSGTFRSNLISFVFSMISEYNLGWVILFIPLGLIASFLPKDKKLAKYLLIIFIIIAPTFIYLIAPHISPRQPWFLRRFIFTIFPFAFLCTAVLFSGMLKGKRVFALVVAMVVLINLVTASPILTFSENNGMLKNVEDLSKLFTKDDIILVDRYAIRGFGGYMMADPLFFVFDKHALWLDRDVGMAGFNQGYNEIKSKVDFSQYRKVYIVTNSALKGNYSVIASNNATLVFEENMTNTYLERTLDVAHWANLPPDIGDIEYSRIKAAMNKPDQIVTRLNNIQVYEVK